MNSISLVHEKVKILLDVYKASKKKNLYMTIKNGTPENNIKSSLGYEVDIRKYSELNNDYLVFDFG